MTIYKKDGNVYTIKGEDVKPIDDSQWEEVKLHNIGGESVTLPAGNPKVTKFKSDFEEVKDIEEEPVVVTVPKIRESITVEKPQEVEKVVSTTPAPIEPVIEYSETDKFIQENKVLMSCVPLIRKERKDELYNESYYSIEYGKEFRFEAIIANQQDLLLYFWTKNVKIDKGSVVSICPRGMEMRESRYWEVYEFENKSGGLLIQAIPSNYSLSF